MAVFWFYGTASLGFVAQDNNNNIKIVAVLYSMSVRMRSCTVVAYEAHFGPFG